MGLAQQLAHVGTVWIVIQCLEHAIEKNDYKADYHMWTIYEIGEIISRVHNPCNMVFHILIYGNQLK